MIPFLFEVFGEITCISFVMKILFLVIYADLLVFFFMIFSSPGQRPCEGYVSYCHHLASVVIKKFSKLFSDTPWPIGTKLVIDVLGVSSIELMQRFLISWITWPLLKLDHKGQFFTYISKTDRFSPILKVFSMMRSIAG